MSVQTLVLSTALASRQRVAGCWQGVVLSVRGVARACPTTECVTTFPAGRAARLLYLEHLHYELFLDPAHLSPPKTQYQVRLTNSRRSSACERRRVGSHL